MRRVLVEYVESMRRSTRLGTRALAAAGAWRMACTCKGQGRRDEMRWVVRTSPSLTQPPLAQCSATKASSSAPLVARLSPITASGALRYAQHSTCRQYARHASFSPGTANRVQNPICRPVCRPATKYQRRCRSFRVPNEWVASLVQAQLGVAPPAVPQPESPSLASRRAVGGSGDAPASRESFMVAYCVQNSLNLAWVMHATNALRLTKGSSAWIFSGIILRHSS